MTDTLNQDDTFALIKVVDVLDSHALPEAERIRIALMYLEELIAERGFDENPLNLQGEQLRIEAEHKDHCVTCQTSYSWQICQTLRKELHG